MMKNAGLFGYLALRFSAHPENLATEALNYILGSSEAARVSFLGLVRELGVGLPEGVRFKTQVVGNDGSIPDMLGTDGDGRTRVVMEAKFWAGLTGNQPVEYLKRLPADLPGVLVVVAPERRFVTLWGELIRRCRSAEIDATEVSIPASERLVATVRGGHWMVLISWRALLGSIRSGLLTARDVAVVGDVEQLEGLCARMDADAFLPIRGDELAVTSPRRLHQYTYLIDELVALALREKICVKRKYKVTSKRGQYGHYLEMHDVGVYLHTDVRKWYQLRQTPFWLDVYGVGWRDRDMARKRLASMESENPSRLIIDQTWNGPVIPLYPPLGEEKDAVLQALLGQLREIHTLLTPDAPVSPVLSSSDGGNGFDELVSSLGDETVAGSTKP